MGAGAANVAGSDMKGGRPLGIGTAAPGASGGSASAPSPGCESASTICIALLQARITASASTGRGLGQAVEAAAVASTVCGAWMAATLVMIWFICGGKKQGVSSRPERRGLAAQAMQATRPGTAAAPAATPPPPARTRLLHKALLRGCIEGVHGGQLRLCGGA